MVITEKYALGQFIGAQAQVADPGFRTADVLRQLEVIDQLAYAAVAYLIAATSPDSWAELWGGGYDPVATIRRAEALAQERMTDAHRERWVKYVARPSMLPPTPDGRAD